MRQLKSALVLIASIASIGLAGVAGAGPSDVSKAGQSINKVGESLETSEGKWTLTNHKSAAGLGVALNGKGVGYAVTLTVGKDGYPRATHSNGKVYRWTGSTFKLEQ